MKLRFQPLAVIGTGARCELPPIARAKNPVSLVLIRSPRLSTKIRVCTRRCCLLLPRTRESIKDVEDNTNNASLLHRTRKRPLGSSRLSERANSKLKPSEYSVPVLGLVLDRKS